MKKIILGIMLVVFTGVNHAKTTKNIKTINGVKIPKGLVGKYDELENKVIIDYPVYSHYSGYSGTYKILSASLKYDNVSSNIAPLILFSLQTMEGSPLPMYKMESFINTEKIIIFVQNQDEIQQYTYILKNKQIEKKTSGGQTKLFYGITSTYQNSVIREYEYTDNTELLLFLVDNINSKSKVSLRFYGKQGSINITQKLSKKDVKLLYSIINLYKQLSIKQ